MLDKFVKKYTNSKEEYHDAIYTIEGNRIDEGFLIFLYCFLIFIVAFIILVTVDPLDKRTVNKLVIESVNEEYNDIRLNKIIKEYEKYYQTMYDFNELIRNKDVYISGTLKLRSMTEDEDRPNLIGFKFAGLYEAVTPDDIVLWIDRESIGEKIFLKGDKVTFKGKVNRLNETYIILNEGVVYND